MLKTNGKGYDFEERTAKFAEGVISFARTLKKDTVNLPLINQLVRSATSIGVNYMEANGASSERDFKNKISISKKEARETKFWLRIIAKANTEKEEKCRELWRECQE
ncbi:MAG: four helix bundle protein, partial [Candidatus Moranbacteria bacterium]|nr:four helix bundle protein [Candidatus Moranbacteria bacterium]